MAVRSIVYFTVKPGKEEQFAAAFTGLRGAAGFPGFLGGDFWRGVRNPNVFGVSALWEDAAAYDRWQARAPEPGSDDPLMQLMNECVDSFEPGLPYEILHTVD